MEISLLKKKNVKQLFRWVDQTLTDNDCENGISSKIKIEAALANMQENNSNRSFSICSARKVYDLFNAKMTTETYKLLDALHCVSWGDMSPNMRATVNALILKDIQPYLDNHEVKTVEIT